MSALFFKEKLKNFPSVNYTSLRESTDRRLYMQYQFDCYGLTETNVYIADRFNKISSQVQVTGTSLTLPEVHSQMGCITSHLNLMRNWYVSTDEEYAIFCEDDTSFESIKYWNFTWDDFVQNLPEGWNGVQLRKILMPYCNPDGEPALKLKLTRGRWWGTCSLFKRSYVKAILDATCRGYNSYVLDSINISGTWYAPIIENLLYLQRGAIYNFPMFVEESNFATTYINKKTITEGVDRSNDSQYWSDQLVQKEWKTVGPTLDFRDAMTLPD